ncbi:hypothetical protein EV356DRAFT_532782 [Viridothelium virens]|uniref:Uncharacterized protein n=1 Tax=Viridothelium virens TaxID=1048519 RepID=A0A6A6HAE1_VIRVR|nr:hypothetical protein EV356DRAFT_532782 [Viridothelium virens]
MDEEQRIAAAKSSVSEIYNALSTNPSAWQFSLTTARGAMTAIDATTYMRRGDQHDDQVWLVNGLQKLAYHEPDVGAVNDISEWCLRSWLVILQNHPNSVEVLKGIGQNWLLKAQAPLARIHRQEVSSSSSGASTGRSATFASMEITRSQEERAATQQAAEAEARLGLPDYVEARAILVPATEYLSRAVENLAGQDTTSGELLSMTAEAYMNLGNVSYARVNEGYFRQAVTYLRRAAAIEGYVLASYLQQYLDDFGRLVE